MGVELGYKISWQEEEDVQRVIMGTPINPSMTISISFTNGLGVIRTFP